MSKIGYTYTHPHKETKRWFDDYGLDTLLMDKPSHGQDRPKLKEAVSLLKAGDELILAGFCNAVRNMNELTLLLELCRLRSVRLISVEDGIDTKDMLFPAKSTEDFLQILSSLPFRIIEMRQSLGEERLQQKCGTASDIKSARVKRDQKVINLYLSGYSLDVIMGQTGIKHSSLYNILKRNGIGRDRIIRKRKTS